jgi:ubiquinone/menaquinone biosynthesis C-methylase UbiE
MHPTVPRPRRSKPDQHCFGRTAVLAPERRARYIRPVRDPVAFSSAQLPTEHFNARFSDENLAFWVPILIECAQIRDGHRVLDVGCGTGGFARAIAEVASAAFTGIDCSERFIAFACDAPAPQRGAVEWKVGSAEALPVAGGSFDRVLLSLVLHQLRHPELAVAEAFRALATGGRVVVRTVAPEDVAERMPERFLPAMAAVDTERMPPLNAIEGWLRDAGFVVTERRRVLRNKKLNLADEERKLLIEVRGRYSFVSEQEFDAGLRLMRAEAKMSGENWIDPRPTHIIAASKTT